MNDKAAIELNDRNRISLEDAIADLLRVMSYLRIYRVNESAHTFGTKVRKVLLIVCLLAVGWLTVAECIEGVRISNLKNIALVLTPVGHHLTGFIKWAYCVKKHREIEDMISRLNTCHLLCLNLDEGGTGLEFYKKELTDAGRLSKLFIYGWIGFCLCASVEWCMNPLLIKLLTDDPNLRGLNDTFLTGIALPFFTWQPWGVDKYYTYAFTYCMQFAGVISATFGVGSFDIFYVSCLLVASAQFRYLNESLKMRGKEYAKARKLSISLKAYIDHHARLVEFLQDLQTLTGPTMFSQCVETLFVICLLSFQASVIELNADPESVTKLSSMLEYFVGVTAQFFVFCYAATDIAVLSTEVAESAYFCGWEVSHETEFKNVGFILEMMMRRTQKPILLTGGPFYILSLETFKSIMGLAISNSLILRQVSEE